MKVDEDTTVQEKMVVKKMMKRIVEEMMVQWLYKIDNSYMHVIYLSNLLVSTCI